MLKNAKIIEYTLKYMSIGIKLTVSSSDIYNRIKEEAVKAGIKFYTHDIEPTRVGKYILSGLPTSHADEIMTTLKEKELDPIDVIELKNTNKNSVTCNYLVMFKGNSVKLENLQRVKGIAHTIVSWRNFLQTKRGPTLCNRCNLYGHGGRNCHFDRRCVKCGENHLSIECTETESLKCCNCGGNHQADYVDCPSRQKFIEMRTKLSSKNTKNNNRAINFPDISQMQHFPPLTPAPRIPSAWSNQFSFKNTTANIGTSNNTRNTNPDLFNSDEIMQITTEVFAGLRSCKTKEDQLRLIFKITSKYLYDGQP